jgi:TPR repeat protein
VIKNNDLFIENLKINAENGNVEAIIQLASILYQQQEYKETFRWCKLAADHDKAQCIIGSLYLYGLGVARDEKEAFKWLKLSAEQGFEIAQVSLCLLYCQGQGATQNPKLSRSL